MWKNKLISFSKKFNHPAWGFDHFERVYKLALLLAKKENVKIDKNLLFAAAYLHDMGAYKPYDKLAEEHEEASVKACSKTLLKFGFSSEKISKVKEIIGSHMFYNKVSLESLSEAIVLRDADTLDFLGVIGITRILSAVGLDEWTPNKEKAISLIEKFSNDLPKKVITKEAKKIAKIRKKEMKEYLKNLSKEK